MTFHRVNSKCYISRTIKKTLLKILYLPSIFTSGNHLSVIRWISEVHGSDSSVITNSSELISVCRVMRHNVLTFTLSNFCTYRSYSCRFRNQIGLDRFEHWAESCIDPAGIIWNVSVPFWWNTREPTTTSITPVRFTALKARRMFIRSKGFHRDFISSTEWPIARVVRTPSKSKYQKNARLVPKFDTRSTSRRMTPL